MPGPKIPTTSLCTRQYYLPWNCDTNTSQWCVNIIFKYKKSNVSIISKKFVYFSYLFYLYRQWKKKSCVNHNVMQQVILNVVCFFSVSVTHCFISWCILQYYFMAVVVMKCVFNPSKPFLRTDQSLRQGGE